MWYGRAPKRYVPMGMSTIGRDALIAGRYRMVDVIGRGGMADVYRATDERLGRPVAVKWLRDAMEDRREEERARAEALLLARLSHPSLVTLFDAGIEAGRPYLVMELIDGPSLAVDAPSDPVAVARVGRQLAEALEYIHGQGLVHRDLKPANVLVPAATEWQRVKLADFGIARLVDATRLTATGTTVGTAAYLAPEQVRGEPVGPAADVWSLGLLLLECLTGHRAYPGPPAEAAVARLHRPPVVPGVLPAGWSGLLRRMTDLDPGARPSAREVAVALEAPAGRSGPAIAATEALDATALDTAALDAAALDTAWTEGNPWGVPAGAPTDVLAESDLDRAFTAGPRRGRGPVQLTRAKVVLAVAVVAAIVIVASVLASASGGRTGGGTSPTTTAGPTRMPAPLPAPSVPGPDGPDLQALHKAVNP